MKNIKRIEGLMNIIDQYDLYILDQWGVMHNGVKGYEHAIKCVNTFLKTDFEGERHIKRVEKLDNKYLGESFLN